MKYSNIDKLKILNSKRPNNNILESYNKAKSSNKIVDIINFMSTYRNTNRDYILENLGSLADINSDITFSYINDVLELSDISESNLNEYKSHINTLLKNANNRSHINRLKETLSIINNIDNLNNDMDNIRDDLLLNLGINRIKESCIFESYLDQELDVLVYNINTSPETIYEYETIIRRIKASKTSEYFSSFPKLLVKNTEMIRNLRITVTGDVLDLLTCMPIVIANKLTKSDISISEKVIKSYIDIYNKQISLIYKELKNNQPMQYNILSRYVNRMIDGKIILLKYINIPVIESSSDSYEETIIDDLDIQIENSLTRLVFDSNEDLNEIELENLVRLTSMAEASAVGRNAIKAGHKTGDALNKGARKIRQGNNTIKRTTLPVKKSLNPLVSGFNSFINKIRQMDKKERHERIITGNFKLKLLNYIKKGIGILAIGLTAKVVVTAALPAIVGPLAGLIVAAITILTAVAIDKNVERKDRQAILIDLQNELHIVEEKIDDAKSDGKRKEKYQLMRIRDKLKKDIERIKYNLK